MTTNPLRLSLLYHFCRLQMPAIDLASDLCERHLQRTFELFCAKMPDAAGWDAYLANLYPLDWYLAVACLEGNVRAWELLFAMRSGHSDCLLVDALRARAARLYPRNEERQDSAVDEFWGHLYVPETSGSLCILARYDGQRPLGPWLIRIFQNWHITQLRQQNRVRDLPEDDLALDLPSVADDRWRDVFAQATRDWLAELDDNDILLLGLRLRYRLSQRETAQMLHIHEGTLSRRTDNLRERCLAFLEKCLVEQGWAGDNLAEYVRTEMQNLLLDAPQLAADRLAKIMSEPEA